MKATIEQRKTASKILNNMLDKGFTQKDVMKITGLVQRKYVTYIARLSTAFDGDTERHRAPHEEVFRVLRWYDKTGGVFEYER